MDNLIWNLETVNECLEGNDSGCRLFLVSEDPLRVEVRWEDTFGECGPEDAEYLMATYEMNASYVSEEGFFAHIASHYLGSPTIAYRWLDELAKYNMHGASVSALISYAWLASGVRQEVLNERFAFVRDGEFMYVDPNAPSASLPTKEKEEMESGVNEAEGK